MSDSHVGDDTGADLLSELDVIEAQPLSVRARSYENLHDVLARRLDTAPRAQA